MIKRYSRKELTDIWSEENKYKIWLDVELAAAEAMEKLGQIPRGVTSIVKRKAKIKDSSSLLLGHGGMLDRLDSLILTTPVTMFYVIAYYL